MHAIILQKVTIIVEFTSVLFREKLYTLLFYWSTNEKYGTSIHENELKISERKRYIDRERERERKRERERERER